MRVIGGASMVLTRLHYHLLLTSLPLDKRQCYIGEHDTGKIYSLLLYLGESLSHCLDTGENLLFSAISNKQKQNKITFVKLL